MTDRPILFSGLMIKALLAGRKTQTRRLIDFPGIEKVVDFVKVGTDASGRNVYEMKDAAGQFVSQPAGKGLVDHHFSPRIAAGDRLWVKETHYLTDDGDDEYAVYVADGNDVTGEYLHEVAALEKLHPTVDWSKHKKQRPSIHMPRWASRLTLPVSGVKIERLQDISEEDAVAEGIQAKRICGVGEVWTHYANPAGPVGWRDPRQSYQSLWDSINGDGAWDANPWVVAYTFHVIKQNIDEVGE